MPVNWWNDVLPRSRLAHCTTFMSLELTAAVRDVRSRVGGGGYFFCSIMISTPPFATKPRASLMFSPSKGCCRAMLEFLHKISRDASDMWLGRCAALQWFCRLHLWCRQQHCHHYRQPRFCVQGGDNGGQHSGRRGGAHGKGPGMQGSAGQDRLPVWLRWPGALWVCRLWSVHRAVPASGCWRLVSEPDLRWMRSFRFLPPVITSPISGLP